jgi:hypothetical protein
VNLKTLKTDLTQVLHIIIDNLEILILYIIIKWLKKVILILMMIKDIDKTKEINKFKFKIYGELKIFKIGEYNL